MSFTVLLSIFCTHWVRQKYFDSKELYLASCLLSAAIHNVRMSVWKGVGGACEILMLSIKLQTHWHKFATKLLSSE